MHQNCCLAWLAAERVMLCTTKKFVKSISTRIIYKRCEDGISQPIKWEIFSILPIAFPSLKWCFELTCHHSAMGDRKVPRNRCCTLHAGCSALIKQCTETFLYMYIFFLEIFMCFFFLWDLLPRRLLSAFCYGMAIWNGWKWKWELNQMLRLVSWCKKWMLICSGTTNTTDTKKAHVQPVAGTFDAHTHAWDQK